MESNTFSNILHPIKKILVRPEIWPLYLLLFFILQGLSSILLGESFIDSLDIAWLSLLNFIKSPFALLLMAGAVPILFWRGVAKVIQSDRDRALEVSSQLSEKARLKLDAQRAAFRLPILMMKSKILREEIDRLEEFVSQKEHRFYEIKNDFEQNWTVVRKHVFSTQHMAPDLSDFSHVPNFNFINVSMGSPTLDRMHPITTAENRTDNPDLAFSVYHPEANSAFLAAHRANFAMLFEWLRNLRTDIETAKQQLSAFNWEIESALKDYE